MTSRARSPTTPAPGGTLLVLAGTNNAGENLPDGPWPLTYDELLSCATRDLALVRLEETYVDDRPRRRAETHRAG